MPDSARHAGMAGYPLAGADGLACDWVRAWIGRRVRAPVRLTGNRMRWFANDRGNAKTPVRP